MAEHHKKLHIVVFPWLAFGHMGLYFELAKVISQKGHKISFISTPRNIHRLPKVPKNLQPFVYLIELPLPHVDQLPENVEATVDIPQHIVPYLKKAYDGLQEPLTKFLERCKPDWIIFDFAPYDTLKGSLVFALRSCMEIEGESLKLFESICGKPVIPVGLLSLSLQFNEDNNNDDNWNTFLNWLDKQEKRSVVYVAFGSEVTLSDEEFTKVAMGLELSGFPFFWALRKQNTSAIESQDWVLSEFKRGMVWRTWAPQLRILVHMPVRGS
ncbi:Putative UDP-rhamnose:rhamnosyltransferase 1 [Glycine soja]|uniref:Putative UDP-rhamnose:rhamnosyltransferase 1 n=2 Tax=Glycine soja TaxID=3848 RepID=A0A0B2PCN2_GLYSO|nr:Putative UDP-rhamnose:rhamnosyltransferase 1 [Glycine soja]